MKLKTLFPLLFCLGIASVHAQVNALPPSRHILVYGAAQARAIPDRFKIAINFESIDPDPDAARRRVESNVQSVLNALKAAGVPAGEIVATSLQVGSRERYDRQRNEQVFAGTAVTRNLTARFSRQKDMEKFLATIKTSQELSISNVSTELSSEPQLKEALRQKAIDSSKAKAEAIAKAYGARLGSVYSVSDVAPEFRYGVIEGEWPATYEWSGAGTLDRIEVTGSRLHASPALAPAQGVSLQSGYVNYDDKIYAVFLLAD